MCDCAGHRATCGSGSKILPNLTSAPDEDEWSGLSACHITPRKDLLYPSETESYPRAAWGQEKSLFSLRGMEHDLFGHPILA